MDFEKQAIKTAVVACIINAEEQVLLARRKVQPFAGQWVMPGGKIDHGESILAALHREVREEVGIEIHVDGLIDVFEHIGVGRGDEHYVILYYRTHPQSLELLPDGCECSEARWVAQSELGEFDLPPGVQHILAQVFPGYIGKGTQQEPGRPESETFG